MLFALISNGFPTFLAGFKETILSLVTKSTFAFTERQLVIPRQYLSVEYKCGKSLPQCQYPAAVYGRSLQAPHLFGDPSQLRAEWYSESLLS